MAQIKLRQVTGLQAALDSKIDIAANIGSGIGLFSQKSGTALQLFSLAAGTGISELSVANNTITINANVGIGAGKLVQLDDSSRLPALNASLLTNISAASLTGSGSLPLSTLLLPVGQLYIGNASNNPTAIAKSAIPLSGFGVPTSDIDIGARKIFTSASSWASNELVPKSYVDAAIQGNVVKEAATVALKTNVNINAPGTVLDGITMAVDKRVFLMGQTAGEQNGVYLWKGGATPMVRATDCDSASELLNMAVYIESGTYAYQTYKLITSPITLDTTVLVFTQIGGSPALSPGDGLDHIGNTFYVKGDNTTIGIVNSKVAVISSATAGQVLISIGDSAQSASWGAIDLSNAATTTGALSFAKGGTGITTLAQHSVPVTLTAANSLTGVLLNSYSVLGRKSGNIVSLAKVDIREITGLRPKTDIVNCVNGNMKLITLSQTPDDTAEVIVFFNGNALRLNVDYLISGLDITATNSLNVAFGGTGNDGLGFAATDWVMAKYTY